MLNKAVTSNVINKIGQKSSSNKKFPLKLSDLTNSRVKRNKRRNGVEVIQGCNLNRRRSQRNLLFSFSLVANGMKNKKICSMSLSIFRPIECLKVRDMIKVMQFVEKDLSTVMPILEPRFILVGSIAEGTRIHWANELDIMMRFNGIQNHPLLMEENPFELKLSIDSSLSSEHHLGKWGNKGIFKYQEFFSFILETLENIIRTNSEKIKELTDSRIKPRQSLNPICPHQEKDQHPHFSHCTKCIFNVTQTKCGACLVFEWKYDKDQNDILTIDLIPVIPIRGKNLNEMMTLITSTLLNERPPNWLRYLKGFINKDQILPESFQDQLNENQDKPLEVGMKLLHYGNGNNFIIRPAQQLAVTAEFEENEELKRVYCQIKCLKSLLRVEINSYFVKKVLLTDEMKGKIHGLPFDIYTILQHPDLKAKFEQVIDYEELSPHSEIRILASKVEV